MHSLITNTTLKSFRHKMDNNHEIMNMITPQLTVFNYVMENTTTAMYHVLIRQMSGIMNIIGASNEGDNNEIPR